MATVGDSFADGFYYGLRSRPDLLKKYDVNLVRWSRASIGLTRDDYFDYSAWLQGAPTLGTADLCVVQIGSNDVQAIPVSKGPWIVFGSEQWQQIYSGRIRKMLDILQNQRCRQLVWVLQPGFEKREFLASNSKIVNQVQSVTLRGAGAQLLSLITSQGDYASDNTHFNRKYVLELAKAMFRYVDFSAQVGRAQCLSCHRQVTVDQFVPSGDLVPLCVLPPAPAERRGP